MTTKKLKTNDKQQKITNQFRINTNFSGLFLFGFGRIGRFLIIIDKRHTLHFFQCFDIFRLVVYSPSFIICFWANKQINHETLQFKKKNPFTNTYQLLFSFQKTTPFTLLQN